ncbi:hypothetical protein DM02DRAFT_721660 [Periconia macrospinosa]|uniref:AB hydrolase-1 domain-containing protein n=1 Tax=Periconia macrospinosa TaxID=97972 RepID=A0A2V1D688_9PLEO|nr:hypothetical protein DM02DRAFT_721660 [Periconia macrospinosa]
MTPLFTISLLLLATTAAATTAASRLCSNITIPVQISSRQGLFKKFPILSNFETQAFSQDFTRRAHNLTQELLEDYRTLEGDFNISARYCRPEVAASSTIQLLTHGIGFDKTYWDLSYNNWNYSYVEVATENGYSTLAIDRLGIGNSSHGDPLNTIQAQAEVEALNEVTTKLRNGQVPGIDRIFNRVIHVGHSFGSIQSYWLSALYPNNTDGLVLTGFSPRGSFLATTVAAWNLHNAFLNQPFRFGFQASLPYRLSLNEENNPLRPPPPSLSYQLGLIEKALKRDGYSFTSEQLWELVASTEIGNIVTGFNDTKAPLKYPPGYLTTSDLTASQYVFLNPGFYDLGLAVLSEQTKQPVTTGELLTLGGFPSFSSFAGPVFVFDGDRDQPFCGGDCYAPTGTSSENIAAESKSLFPAQGVFGAYLQPNTGHGINFHYNATAGYHVIQRWLVEHGLRP